MAISEIHAAGSCKAVPPSSRCYLQRTGNSNRNRNWPQSSPLTLGSTHASLPLFIMLLVAAMLTSCLALPSETTTSLPSADIELATTVIPPQQPLNEANSPLSSTPPTVAAAVNESIVKIEPLKTSAAEVADEFVHTSFVSLGGEGLEQGIRNAVKSEVELEIEADSSAAAAVEPQQAEEQADKEQNTTDTHVEHTDAAQGVREPKTLDAEAETNAEPQTEGEKATHVVEDSDKLSPVVEAEAEEKAEAEDNTEKTVEEIANNNNDKSTSESVTEEKADAVAESQPEPEPVTDKTVEQVEPEQPNRPLPSVTSDLVSVIFDENRAITEQPITNSNREALEQEHDKVLLAEQKPEPTFEVTKHQVTKKQGVEDLLPIEVPNEAEEKQEEPEAVAAAEPEKEPETLQAVENTPKATTENAVHVNEIEENIIDSDANDKEVQQIASSSAQPERVESTEPTVSVAAPVEEVAVEANKPVDVASVESSEESLTPTEASIGQAENAEAAVAEVETEAEAEKKPEPEAEPAESVVVVGESSSTASPVESEAVEVDKESEAEADSDESEQKTDQPAAASGEKDSSEESDEVSADEPKARAEDSTATPLVSYPPHNAGQTFDSNLADERSAYLSLSSSNRSTLIIALCSGTAVIFIVISLVIFVLSFQRQHGTLDIEMQEQRLGKDTLDEEDAQMKLLDVDLSTPVIIAMGNEETDECL
ncbi:cytadherence high molecular weight protein 1 [Drosophila sulfurigaster albostrigata]|uniref:cytadherence high molecular weight protein 1 n=1 Tax=Drosophila sulfurigaster albostrigata TaxID=89887 RepID=UPI002D21DABF|nr:cytadherence high molecular weight protein 1 [Drosophila sulfurigaster albostrigata]